MTIFRRERLWQLYTLFYDPPGVPKEKRCIGCRVATSATSFTLAGLTFYAAKRATIKNVYRGVTLGLVGTGLLVLGGVAARMAIEDNKYNEYHMERYEEDRKKKLENEGKLIGKRTETL